MNKTKQSLYACHKHHVYITLTPVWTTLDHGLHCKATVRIPRIACCTWHRTIRGHLRAQVTQLRTFVFHHSELCYKKICDHSKTKNNKKAEKHIYNFNRYFVCLYVFSDTKNKHFLASEFCFSTVQVFNVGRVVGTCALVLWMMFRKVSPRCPITWERKKPGRQVGSSC